MASKTRHIDAIPAPDESESKPMHVLFLGLSRTATFSLYRAALPKLGLNSYHAARALDPERVEEQHLILWNEAIEAKYGIGTGTSTSTSSPSASPSASSSAQQYTPPDFAKILHSYSAATDIPIALFAAELMDAYPEAHLVLNQHPRGVDGWVQSIRRSYYGLVNWAVWDWVLVPFDTEWSAPGIKLIRSVLQIWTGKSWPEAGDFATCESELRLAYAEHNDAVRRLARERGREVLEWNAGMGWEPLCKFIGKEVPKVPKVPPVPPGAEGEEGEEGEEEPFPHVNGGDFTVEIFRGLVGGRLRRCVLPKALGSLVVGAAGLVVGTAFWG